MASTIQPRPKQHGQEKATATACTFQQVADRERKRKTSMQKNADQNMPQEKHVLPCSTQSLPVHGRHNKPLQEP
jgi:hypothetical protein